MLILYRFIINLIFVLSPIIILIRLIKKKEDLKRFKEKLGFFSKNKNEGRLIWFHGASVGELQSIVPILQKFEKNKEITQILITSNTLSSSNVIKKLKLNKVIHQFFPIDSNIISKKFIKHWRPSKVFFIDSEIWPNMIFNLKEKKIPIILINARITKKSYKRWKFFPNFAKKIFNKFDLSLSSNKESLKYLKNLGVKNIKFIGNLKFAQAENEISIINKKLKNFLKIKKTWCASSTHQSEELICGIVHNNLKKRIKNLLTIIIPRHIERTPEIKNQLEKLNLKVHLHEPQKKINPHTDIYLVNAYGKTKSFYNITKNVFLGGSLIKHGGQNPLEAVRFGCNIFHGPNIYNFREIYQFLKKQKISNKIFSQNELTFYIKKMLSKKSKQKRIKKRLSSIGNEILKKTYKEINYQFKHENYQT